MADFSVWMAITNNTKHKMYFDMSKSSLDRSAWQATPSPIKPGETKSVAIADDHFAVGARGTATYFITGDEKDSYYSFYGSCPVGDASNAAEGPGLGAWNEGGHPLNANFTVETDTVPSSYGD